jgi:hypothetical protein
LKEVSLTKKLGPTVIPLSPEHQDAVLNYLVVPEEGTLAGRTLTVGELLSEAKALLDLVNGKLRSDPLLGITANNLMKLRKRRGSPRIIADINGTVSLCVHYGEEQAASPSGGNQALPSLTELRLRAREAGVDISDLGRKKRKILKRLSEAALSKYKTPPEHLNGVAEVAPGLPPEKLRDEVSQSTLPKKVRIPRGYSNDVED